MAGGATTARPRARHREPGLFGRADHRRHRARRPQRRDDALDPAVLGRPVEVHRQRARADERAQQQPVIGVVDELEADVGTFLP
jgi:hypothetical protein